MQQWDNSLDQYEEELGLAQCHSLNLQDNELKGMSPEELDLHAVILARFSLHLQKHINKNQARIRWAEHSLGAIIGRECSNVKAYSYEERRLIIIHSNSYAVKLDEILHTCLSRIDRINFFVQRIEFLSGKLSQLSFTKRNVKL